MSDKRWARWSSPLARFLGTGKDWNEIEEWSRTRGDSITFVRHMVVWLEHDGQIEAVRMQSGTWSWRKVGAARYDASADTSVGWENDPWLEALSDVA